MRLPGVDFERPRVRDIVIVTIVAMILSARISAYQAETGLLVMTPLEPACAQLLILTPTRARWVEPLGTFNVPAHEGSSQLHLTSGLVRAEMRIMRGDRVVRSATATAGPGSRIDFKPGLFSIETSVGRSEPARADYCTEVSAADP